jgi:hypothetical protein
VLASVLGVRRVASELHSPDTLAKAGEKVKDA